MELIRRFFLSSLLSLLFFLSATVAIQAQIAYFNTDAFWSKMSLKPSEYPTKIHPSDTAVIVASNRVFKGTAFRFLPDVYKGGVSYYVVYSRNAHWNVIPVHNLETALHYLPQRDKDWVIYTEGMGKLFTTNADRAMSMSAFYGVNVIMLDYPSISSKYKRTRNYFFSKRNAEIAYKDFAPVLDTLKMLKQKNELGNGAVNLFFHSMGNIVLMNTLKHYNLHFLNDRQWVNNLILNAACVPQYHHAKWLDKVRFAKRIYVLYNHKDYTLGGAYFMSKKNQLGMKVKRPLSKKAVYINFRYLVDKRHSNFLNLIHYPPQPAAALKQYRVLLHGNAVDVNDSHYFRHSEYKNIGWDILP
jgi:hypothetical protein